MNRSLTLALLLGFSAASMAADWPCWRGPDGLGVSAETRLPEEWSRSENIAWQIALPGKGASSPVVVGDRIYLTSQTADQAHHVLGIETKTGRVVWDKEVGQGKIKAHDLHNMATPSAVSDGKRVWVRFGTGDVACLNDRGETIWKRQLGKEFGHYNANHGMGTSPMLRDGRLYIACMHQGPSYLMALDAGSGKTLWKKERDLGPIDEAQDSYSSPIFVRSGEAAQVVVAGSEAVNAYDPATGEQLWIHGGLKVPHPYGRTIAGLAAGDGVVITVASGFQNRGFTIALGADGKGTLPDSRRLWTMTKFSPDCPTPVVYQGKVYCIRDDGMASCLDLKTGEAHWQERLFTENVKVSPVAGDGKIYFMSGQGNCAVVRAGTKFEVIKRNELKEATLSSPALSGGRMYLRTQSQLYCIGG